MPNVKEWLKNAKVLLSSISDTPQLDAELILCDQLKKQRPFLYAYPETALTKDAINGLDKKLQARLKGEPIAYILKSKEFWSLSLHVTPDTLIPRQETEILVEVSLLYLQDKINPIVIDLGTGSGAIALAIAKERPDAEIYATDLSLDALQVAKKNALSHHLTNISFFQSNWFQSLPSIKPILIVSNPPYVQEDSIHLEHAVKQYQPHQALISADNGLADLKSIIKNSVHWLANDGMLLLEFGIEQHHAIEKEMNHFGYNEINFYQDLQGITRAASGKR